MENPLLSQLYIAALSVLSPYVLRSVLDDRGAILLLEDQSRVGVKRVGNSYYYVSSGGDRTEVSKEEEVKNLAEKEISNTNVSSD